MNERSIFMAALERDTPDQRSSYLDEACAGDATLRQRVEALLHSHEQAGSFLKAPVPALILTVDEPVSERPGTIIGPYKLMEQIGEGGMGLVFVAEQQQPVRRKVALKVIKPGMDTREVIARFEAERQALALMDHPNIARVLDGGTTESGRPYFVMELVKGVPITQFCDDNRLTPRERLELFVCVCHAVQHAHQKGIIHRDVKPSNVLVTSHDGTPVVKVIDFGVAKAIGQQLTEKTVYTGFAQMLGTPMYMSPEQAGMSGLDIDTRTDIYALGVLLYELLTGTTPFDKERMKEASYDEIRRIIREEEPPKPSMRISTLGQASATVSANRRSDPRKLSQLMRGELDWLVMKALEKDRNRRYETANNFAADVQRYLNDEPVEACPPSAWYRLRKFTRRNKRALMTTAVVAVAVLLGISSLAGGIGWNLRDKAVSVARTNREVDQILQQAEELRELSKWPEARAAVEKAQVLLKGRGGNDQQFRRAAELLADLEMAARLEDVTLEPDWKSKESNFSQRVDFDQMDSRYARAFREYGIDLEKLEVEDAAAHIRARAIRVELAAALDHWANLRRVFRKADATGWKHLLAVARAADPDERRNQFREALEQGDQQALRNMAASDQVTALPPLTLVLLADRLAFAGAIEEAVALLRKAQQQYPGDFRINATLALRLDRNVRPRQLDEAIRFYSAALALRPQSALVCVNLGNLLDDKGAWDEALAVYKLATRLQPGLVIAHNNLGITLDNKGLYDDALAAYEQALRLEPNNSNVHSNRGGTLAKQKKLDPAVAAFKEAIRLKPENATAHGNLGVVLREKKLPAEAVLALRKSLDLRPGHFLVQINLAEALHEQGSTDEALDAYREAFRHRPRDAKVLLNLGATLNKRGLLDEAITAFGEAIGLKPELADAHAALGDALSAKAQLEGAIRAYREAVRLKPDYAQAHHNLGLALVATGRIDEAIRHYREAIRLRPQSSGFHLSLGTALCDHKRDYEGAIGVFKEAIRLQRDNAVAHDNLGIALSGKGDYDGAIVAFREAVRLRPDDAMKRWKLGNAFAARRQYEEAITAYGDATRLKPDLFEAHFSLGRALAGKRALREAIDAYQEAARLKPNDAQCQFELADQFAAAGQLDEAEKVYALAVTLWRKRAAEPSAPPAVRSQLGAVLNNFAMLGTKRKKPAEAVLLLEEAITFQKAALDLDPKNPRYRQFLRNHYQNLADARLALGDHAAAAQATAEPPRLFPDSWDAHFRAVDVLVRCIQLAQEDAGLPETKRQELAQAYAIAVRGHAREAVKRCGDNPIALDSLAWFLANSQGFRAPVLAVELAQQAVELAPRQGEYRTTLGAAHYRAGNWKEAVKALEESMAQQKGASGPAGFFLAMAHWQLGNKPVARQCYEQALQGMEKKKPGDGELRFFRDEAAELLGIEKKN